MSDIANNSEARLGAPGLDNIPVGRLARCHLYPLEGRTGISIGKPLEDFQGVLRGVPTYTGGHNPLLESEADGRFGPSHGDNRV